MTERVHTVVIGAGQAGLSTSHHLSERGIEHVILDKADAVGEDAGHVVEHLAGRE